MDGRPSPQHFLGAKGDAVWGRVSGRPVLSTCTVRATEGGAETGPEPAQPGPGLCQASPAPPGPRGRLPAPESSTGHFWSAWAQSDPHVGFLKNRATCLKRWDRAFLVQVPGSLPAPHCTFLPFREPGCPLLICPASHTLLEHVALIPSLAWGPYPRLSPTQRDGPACLPRVPQEGNGAGD